MLLTRLEPHHSFFGDKLLGLRPEIVCYVKCCVVRYHCKRVKDTPGPEPVRIKAPQLAALRQRRDSAVCSLSPRCSRRCAVLCCAVLRYAGSHVPVLRVLTAGCSSPKCVRCLQQEMRLLLLSPFFLVFAFFGRGA